MKFKSLSAGKAAFARRKRKSMFTTARKEWTQEEIKEFQRAWMADMAKFTASENARFANDHANKSPDDYGVITA